MKVEFLAVEGPVFLDGRGVGSALEHVAGSERVGEVFVLQRVGLKHLVAVNGDNLHFREWIRHVFGGAVEASALVCDC